MVDQSIIAGLIFTENDERKVFEKYHIKDISPLTYQFLDSKTENLDIEPPKLVEMTKEEQLKKKQIDDLRFNIKYFKRYVTGARCRNHSDQASRPAFGSETNEKQDLFYIIDNKY